MKNLVFLILGLVLLASCSMPVPDEQLPEANNLGKDYKALQGKYNTLQANYDNLKRASADSKELQEKYNSLANELQSLRIEKAVYEVQIQNLTGQYNSAIAVLSTEQSGNLKALEEMNKQLSETIERQRIINEQIQKVRDKKVQLLSDNLTSAEYSAFYKGWELWWWTFNEKE